VDIAYEEVKIAVDKLSSRPRKCLGFKAPYEVFYENSGIDVSKIREWCTYESNPSLIKGLGMI
jgi:hypothetical protein